MTHDLFKALARASSLKEIKETLELFQPYYKIWEGDHAGEDALAEGGGNGDGDQLPGNA